MARTFDVGIVGGGIHGVSAALAVVERGASCVLFEREHPASGPTGRSSAICRAYYTDPFLAEAARASLDVFADFAARVGGDAGFHRTGALFLHGADDVAAVERTVPMLNRIGTVADVLSPQEIADRLPGARVDDLAIGVWERDAGYADPAGTTTAMFERAKRLGLTARLRTTVVGIDCATVRTSDGDSVDCGRVLLAAGPWTRPLAATVGVDLPLTVERHWVATAAWGDSPRIPFAFADVAGGYYAKPDGDEVLCLGPLTEEPAADPDQVDGTITAEEQERMLAAVVARVPSLDDLRPTGGWSSVYDVSPDWQPVIGEVAPDVFVDAGTSGHGFKLAPALGGHVAALVLGQAVDERLAAFHPRRFAEGASRRGGFRAAAILG